MLTLLATRWHIWIPLSLTQWSHLEANIERKMLGLAPLSNISNCIVLILYRQLGNYLLGTSESYSLATQHIHRTLYKSMFDTNQHIDYSQRANAACWIESWCQCIVVIYVENKCLAGVETLAQSSAHRMHTMETPATEAPDATTPQRVLRPVHYQYLNFLNQEEIILAHTGMCCLLLPRNTKETLDSSVYCLQGSVQHK